ncbi:Transducin beta-like protein 2 [Triticum urartu]|uniref:Transducin beta-like protein 2 n=1 Tax=Triticum urartu TaxID=4572 RepID=M8ABA1_TRIUA|nr:Transducin beta-like protein 2 [Triticum urartu]
MASALSVPLLSALLGGAVALAFLARGCGLSSTVLCVFFQEAAKKHHHLDVNTLRGHTDCVTALDFSTDACNLATVCADGVVRVFRIDDASSKSFKILKINLPAGAHPTAIAYSEGSSSVVVAAQALLGSSLYMYADVGAPPTGGNKQQGKLSPPEIKWDHKKIHGKESVLNLAAARATHGTGDGSTIVISCSEGYKFYFVLTFVFGNCLQQLISKYGMERVKNNMADISPNGRFIAAAAFTADVKVWEIVYSKDSSVKEVNRVMQLKGHKSAVTSLCFTPDSEKIITASKDGTIRVWNINVRYHLDEDPKTLRVLPVPLHDSKGSTCLYEHMGISPDGKVLAVTSGSTLQWLCAETGVVLDTAEKAHEDLALDLLGTCLGGAPAFILGSCGDDKKVKLWLAPEVSST